MQKTTVIIPVCNVEKFIDHCLTSIINQTYKDLEILLMVGVCNDTSLEKCVEWQKKDDRIIIISRKDSSLGDARNYALNIAAGKYIAYLDADDFVEPDYIEKMVRPLEEDESIDITCCGYGEYKTRADEKIGFMPSASGIYSSSFQSYLELLGGNAARMWTKVYRKKWLSENKIFQFDGCCEDQAVKFMLASKVRKIFCIQKILYHYRVDNLESLVHSLKGNTDYPRSVAFGIEYLKRNGVYEEVKEIVKRHIMGEIFYIFDKLNNHKEMLAACEEFFKSYFPDVLTDYQQYIKERKKLKEKYILFGAGAELIKVLNKIDKSKVNYIVDNNACLAGKKVEGLEIKPFRYLETEYKPEEETVLITSYKYCQEMARQLWDSGITGFWMARDVSD